MCLKYSSFLESFAKHLALQGKRPQTIKAYCTDVEQFLKYLELNNIELLNLSYHTIINYQDYLNDDKKDEINTIRRETLGIKQFFKFLSENSIIPAFPFEKVPIPPRDESLSKYFNYEILDKILTHSINNASSFKELRDACILALLGYEGLKNSEVAALLWKDYIKDDFNAFLTINGVRQRVIKICDDTATLLEKYKNLYENIVQKYIQEPLDNLKIIVSFKGNDTLVPAFTIGRHGIKFILYEIGKKFNFNYLNSELLRHYCIARFIKIGVSTEQIMRHLGLHQQGNIAKHRALIKAKDMYNEHLPK